MRKKGALKKRHHILTVRFMQDEWQHVLRLKAALEKSMEKGGRRRITYNEVVVGSVVGREPQKAAP